LNYFLLFIWKICFVFTQESQTQCNDIENERQRIQTEFENYYQQTHHLEQLQQQKSLISNNSEEINQVF
jgi:hypothetical protein